MLLGKVNADTLVEDETCMKLLKMFQTIVLMVSARLVIRCDLHDRDIPLYQLTIGKASQTHHGGIDAMASNPLEISSEHDYRLCVFEIAMHE